MQLEWDEAKRRANLIKHRVDFEGLDSVFVAPERLEVPDRRRDYGEVRVVILCPVRGRLLHITYTPRGEKCRVISARRANHREQRFYERSRRDHQGGRDS